MPSKRKRNTNTPNFTRFFGEVIPKLIYLCFTIGFIFTLCPFILPDNNKPTQSNSLIITPTLKLENTPTLPPISPTKKLEQTPTTIITKKPIIHTTTPTVEVIANTLTPTITPTISTTPNTYCSFLVEQLPPTFTGTSYIIADLDTEEILLKIKR